MAPQRDERGMDAEMLRSKADRCRRLAGLASNRDIRATMETLAREFDERAAALEHDAHARGHVEGGAS
jgi:hypothetical protein